ncbi:MAG: hypothetical protein IIA03_10415, partial [Proteobacteria bacterium]|nr:hypothetical protein [Pseudomonadota bacterium]
QEAGVLLDGLVLQSPALDYNSNCGISTGQGCSGYLPSLAMVGAFHRLTRPLPTDLSGWASQARSGSALAAEGDPSATWLTDSFAVGIASHLRDQLGYRNASTYVLLSDAISVWDFSHAGRSLPDTLPDLAVALAQNPRLRVLAISGYHDLATPFHLTETDLARVDASRVRIRNYAGGHMSYLDDTTRPQQLADLKAFYAATLALRASADLGPERRALQARPVVAVDRAGRLQQPGSVAPTNEKPVQAPLRDPWVPPSTLRAR